MGLRGIPEAVIDFEDMELPPSALVMPPRGLKKGFADLMNAYNSQRVGAATVALGIAEGAYELALDWSEKRHQFGRPINEFQGLQWKLADMSIKLARGAGAGLRRRPLGRRRLPRHAAGGAGQGLHLGKRHPGRERRPAVLRRARLLARAAAGAHGARRAHVHHRRRHGARCCATSWRARCSRRSCRRRATAGANLSLCRERATPVARHLSIKQPMSATGVARSRQ